MANYIYVVENININFMKINFPPFLVMENIHSKIKNISNYPWFVLACPFFVR